MKTFYTGDLYIDSKDVAKQRGYRSSKAFDDHLAMYWDKSVRSRDWVIVLGDITTAEDPSKALEWLQIRRGNKVLITGDRDVTHINTAEDFDWNDTFIRIMPSAISWPLDADGDVCVVLNHYPYGHKDDPKKNWIEPYPAAEGVPTEVQKEYRRLPILHAHTRAEKIHSRRREDGAHQINVGWDAWYAFPTADELLALLKIV